MPKHKISPSTRFFPHKERYEIFDGNLVEKFKKIVQDFVPIRTALRSVTKSSTSRFSHENLVEKFKIFVQDFVPIRTALTEGLGAFRFFFKQGFLGFISRNFTKSKF